MDSVDYHVNDVVFIDGPREPRVQLARTVWHGCTAAPMGLDRSFRHPGTLVYYPRFI